MPANKKSKPSEKASISISGDVRDSNVFIGDNNIFKKIVKYIFPSEKETLEQRNRRILLNHVENAWIKGVLDASLHGAALLDLGIKQDLEAVTKYPWAIKKESSDETLPAGTSMLEIFDSIGMGRSLLILGAPGSGKTTMLLELARQLIARAREDVTQPIPMVFNLASWTEKLSLADWLAQELNNLYSVPRKTAPEWVQGNKLLLLLDGLDEVRQESRAKCVEAINAFRKEHGLTSLAVCSRSQDYAELNAKLSFEGAIEVQPLTQEQIAKFFKPFGKEIAGIKQVLKKDSALREMAETPLFLSIMILAYRDKQDVDIWVSGGEKAQRKHLFDTYIKRMFERPRREKYYFKKQGVLHWLSWLAQKMITHNVIPYLIENMQPSWAILANPNQKFQFSYKTVIQFNYSIIFGLTLGLQFGLQSTFISGVILSLFFTIIIWLGVIVKLWDISDEIKTVNSLRINWASVSLLYFISWTISIFIGFVSGAFIWAFEGMKDGIIFGLISWFISGLIFGTGSAIFLGVNSKEVDQTKFVGQKITSSFKNSLYVFICTVLLFGIIFLLSSSPDIHFGLPLGLIAWMIYGGLAITKHYTLRFILAINNLLPWRLVPFLDHCVDLIFLRRVGGGYIFVHRLLMEHFAEMYVETQSQRETKSYAAQ